MVKLEKETIGSGVVAVVLNVSMSSIYRMTVSKELNPISGPGVDGYPVNLFLRRDVEDLNVAREALKSECVRIGKTTRFGRTSGNRSCPVQEKVMHRVKQLLEEQLSYTEAKQRVSGLELHRHLIKEGYKIGTTTIYKILRKQLDTTY